MLAGVVASLGLLTQPASAVEPYVVGGVDAEGAYPFVVSLQTPSGQHFCGGSLIESTWVVTAAHCVQGKDPATTTARIGSNDRTAGGEQRSVTRIMPHPEYNPSGAGGDIALVQLSAPARAEPISLGDQAAPGTASRLLGWGQTCPSSGCGELPKNLQQLDTRVLAGASCPTTFNADVELCTDNPGGKAGSCYGDSGGPQIAMVDGRWRLLGLTSRSGNNDKTCVTAPSIYTSAVAYSSWIETETYRAAAHA